MMAKEYIGVTFPLFWDQLFIMMARPRRIWINNKEGSLKWRSGPGVLCDHEIANVIKGKLIR